MGNLWTMRVGSGNGRGGVSLATERKPSDNGNERVSGGEWGGDNRTIDEMRKFLTK